MIYTEKQIIELMENSDVIVRVDKGYMVNTVFQKFVKAQKREGYCKNYPDDFKGLSDSLIYKKVMQACDVPLMHKSDISYFVRTETKASIAALKKLLAREDIDYDVFVASSKRFYNSDISVPGFAKYIQNKLWENVYDETAADQIRTSEQKGVF